MTHIYAQKTFVIEREDTYQSQIEKKTIMLQSPQTDLSQIFSAHCPNNKCSIKIYNPSQNCFVKLSKNSSENYIVPVEFLQPDFIFIKFTFKNQEYKTEQESNHGSAVFQINLEKKDRSRQRTIEEVLQLVKKWRKMHTNKNQQGKKLSLQQAAKAIGISKKSLDDYYYQLRLGQQYGFKFQENMHNRIGLLRDFVKESKPPKSDKGKNSKHPKNLQIIEETKKNSASQTNEVELKIVHNQEQNKESILDDLDLSHVSEAQNNFFQNFLCLAQQYDPFANFMPDQFNKRTSEQFEHLY